MLVGSRKCIRPGDIFYIYSMKITKEDREGLEKVFKDFGRKKSDEEIFYDLCFCVLTPQTTFKSVTKVINNLIDLDFYSKDYDEKFLREIVKPARFYRNKTRYLFAIKKELERILWFLESDREDILKRDFLVKHVKGLGMKTASHFLRNLGNTDLAIIDTHIIKFMVCSLPKNRKEYLKIEKKFQERAEELDLTPAELDALVWKKFSKTSWEDFKW